MRNDTIGNYSIYGRPLSTHEYLLQLIMRYPAASVIIFKLRICDVNDKLRSRMIVSDDLNHTLSPVAYRYLSY